MRFRLVGDWVELDGPPEEQAIVIRQMATTSTAVPLYPPPPGAVARSAAEAPAKPSGKKHGRPAGGKANAAKPEKSAAPAASPLEAYPNSLRDPRANVMRAAYDALKGGTKTLSEVCNWIFVHSDLDIDREDSGKVYSALHGLRNKAIARKEDGFNGAWRLV